MTCMSASTKASKAWARWPRIKFKIAGENVHCKWPWWRLVKNVYIYTRYINVYYIYIYIYIYTVDVLSWTKVFTCTFTKLILELITRIILRFNLVNMRVRTLIRDKKKSTIYCAFWASLHPPGPFAPTILNFARHLAQAPCK